MAMGKYYLKYANRLFLITYVVMLHVCSFYYDVTNVGQALINLDNNFVEIFFHEFVSVMLMALLITSAIHIPVRLWFKYQINQTKRTTSPILNSTKQAIINVESQPVPGELLENLSAN